MHQNPPPTTRIQQHPNLISSQFKHDERAVDDVLPYIYIYIQHIVNYCELSTDLWALIVTIIAGGQMIHT